MNKFIYSTLVALSLSSMASARNPPGIQTMPAEANDYLILNKAFYRNVQADMLFFQANQSVIAGPAETICARICKGSD